LDYTKLNETKRKGGEEMHRKYLPEGLIKPDFARLYNIGCFKSVFRGLLSYHKRLYQLEGTEGSDTDRIYTDALETALELFDKEEKRLNEKLGNGRLPTTDREGNRVDERQKPRKYTGFGDDPLLDPNYDWNSSLKDKGR
jgi:hypothetical protein